MSRSCKIRLPFLMAITAAIKSNAVMPLMVAYIGGKKLKGFTFGILIPNKAATAMGNAIETIVISVVCLCCAVNLKKLNFIDKNNGKREY